MSTKPTILAAAVLACALSARAQSTLTDAFAQASATAGESARAQRSAALPPLESVSLFQSASFVPPDCRVLSWCLVKATDCFLGYVDQPEGLWQGHAQYSVVRRAIAQCPSDAYGDWETVTLTGPVEPVVFASPVETSRAQASSQAVATCSAYRKDWVDAAPACAPTP